MGVGGKAGDHCGYSERGAATVEHRQKIRTPRRQASACRTCGVPLGARRAALGTRGMSVGERSVPQGARTVSRSALCAPRIASGMSPRRPGMPQGRPGEARASICVSLDEPSVPRGGSGEGAARAERHAPTRAARAGCRGTERRPGGTRGERGGGLAEGWTPAQDQTRLNAPARPVPSWVVASETTEAP
jgi:hypothetical protein